MTIILETNKDTYKKLIDGKISFVISKFRKEPSVGDTLVFQEMDGDIHTGAENKFEISQIETEGCKTNYFGVAFKEKE